jgi:hypothetical protein
MPQYRLFANLMLGALGLIAGFLALAIEYHREKQIDCDGRCRTVVHLSLIRPRI